MKNTFLISLLLILFVSLLSSCNNSEDKEDFPTLVIPKIGFESPKSYPGLNLTWADEFNETNLNMDNWNYQIGNGCPDLCGWGNNELQYYKKENISFKDGNLVITAKNDKTNSNNYSSSRINTLGKFGFHFGRIDIRAVLPAGQGVWPAIWMLGDEIVNKGWPASGEIDIMEMIGGSQRENTVHATLHWDNKGDHASLGKEYTLNKGTFQDEFHVFSIIWKQDSIIWLIDNVEYNKIDISENEMEEFQGDFHFLFNIAVGGNWPGSPDNTTIFPQYLIVDYIRVFQ